MSGPARSGAPSRPGGRVARHAFLVLLALGGMRGELLAHERSVSYSEIDWRDPVARIRARVTRLDLSRLPIDPFAEGEREQEIAGYLGRRLVLTRGGAPCLPEGPIRALTAPAGWAVFEWDLRCPGEGPPTLASHLFEELAPSHLHFARLRSADGATRERVLSDHERSWVIASPTSPGNGTEASGTSFLGYLLLGIEHILSGWDHLAFVAALLLLASSLGEVATLVTAFTAAHSITLAVAALGVLHIDGGRVEALIGFSIALVAVENAWLVGGRDRRIPAVVIASLAAATLLAFVGIGGLSAIALAGLGLFALCHFALLDRTPRPARLRAAVAFGFGLVHGFGFAGVLGEMHLPRARLVPALLGFNLGVEVGQLMVVSVLWPLLRALSRIHGGRPARWVVEIGSSAIFALGLYWFLIRTYA